MPKFLAFDAAQKTGIAYRYAKIYISDVVNPKDKQRLGDIIENAKETGVTYAIIEEPFLSKKYGPVALMSLVGSMTRIEVECENHDLPVRRVKAKVWQCGLGITGGHDEVKPTARRVAKMLSGRDYTEEEQDEADAVCMCAWAERKYAMEEMVKPVKKTRRSRK